jgi:hypothetical protein
MAALQALFAKAASANRAERALRVGAHDVRLKELLGRCACVAGERRC